MQLVSVLCSPPCCVTNDIRCARENNSSIDVAKAAFNKKNTFNQQDRLRRNKLMK